jgi:hypothetical protein
MENLITASSRKYLPCIKRFGLLVSLACALSVNAAEIAAPPSNLTSTERQRLLETDAKKEGRVIFYGVSADMDKLFGPFREKYPYIAVDHFRAGGAALTSKILTESRAGKTARRDRDERDSRMGSHRSQIDKSLSFACAGFCSR